MTTSIGYALGAGSGLDIQTLVNQLSDAAKAPKAALITSRETANQAKVSGLAQVSSAIDSFASALGGLIAGGTLFSQPSVSDPSVFTASAIAGARLVVKGRTGGANAFALSVAGGTTSGLERFATDAMDTPLDAHDALVKLDGVELSRATNSFSDVISGVQIELKTAKPGTPVSVGVTRPTAAISQGVQDFVSAY